MSNKTIYYSPPPPKPATLLILENGKPLRVVTLNGDATIGRKDTEIYSDITLESAIVSRPHGRFSYIDEQYYYQDINSLNGTYLNGKKMKPINERGTKSVPLQDGDVLRIDRSTLNNPHPEAVEIIYSTVFSPNEKWQKFSLKGRSEVKIGRDTAGLQIPDFTVSRHHATLKLSGKKWIISDNNSTNGIAVNNEVITGKKVLNLFDVIRISNTTLIFTGSEIIYNTTGQTSHETKFHYSERSVIMSIIISSVYTKALLNRKILLKDIMVIPLTHHK